jgi:hypothetical protein
MCPTGTFSTPGSSVCTGACKARTARTAATLTRHARSVHTWNLCEHDGQQRMHALRARYIASLCTASRTQMLCLRVCRIAPDNAGCKILRFLQAGLGRGAARRRAVHWCALATARVVLVL